MGLKQAAVGNLATFARSLEKVNIGLPSGGAWKFLNFISAEISRTNKHNPSTSITGSGGTDRGTLGEAAHTDKVKYDATTARLALDLAAMVGCPTTAITSPATGVYLYKVRPDRDNPLRSLSFLLDEGGSYAPSMQFGRRCQDVILSTNANKRVETDVTYSEPTGDSISGVAIDKSGNTGSASLVSSRGRRPYDADFTAGKSVYLKVISSTTGGAVLKAKIDVPSGGTDGTGFGAAAYGSTTFAVSVPTDSADGWAVVIDSTSGYPVGLFGENNEPFEITLGDTDLTAYAANDEFEIPVSIARIPKTGTRENRLSAFHLVRLINGTTDVRIDTGTMKISRPFKAYYANGRRFPQTIDPTGKLSLTTNFKKRLFDRAFRQVEDSDSRFTLYDDMKFQSPIGATAYFEQVEFFQPQCMVSALKSGDVAGFDALEETVTLEAEQPDDTADGTLTTGGLTVPAGFDDTTKYPWQCNITTPIDITAFGT